MTTTPDTCNAKQEFNKVGHNIFDIQRTTAFNASSQASKTVVGKAHRMFVDLDTPLTGILAELWNSLTTHPQRLWMQFNMVPQGFRAFQNDIN